MSALLKKGILPKMLAQGWMAHPSVISNIESDKANIIETYKMKIADFKDERNWTTLRENDHMGMAKVTISCVNGEIKTSCSVPSCQKMLVNKEMCRHVMAAASTIDLDQAAKQTSKNDPKKFKKALQDAMHQAAIEQIVEPAKHAFGRGLKPFFLGPPGCGKTYGLRLLSHLLNLEFHTFTCEPANTPHDLAGIVLPENRQTYGPLYLAMRSARLGQESLFFLDEIPRANLEMLASLMQMLDTTHTIAKDLVNALRRLPENTPWRKEHLEAATALDEDAEIIYYRSNLLDEWLWAPRGMIQIALGGNPWGTELDPALISRVYPVEVDYSHHVTSLFSKRIQDAFKIVGSALAERKIAMPITYRNMGLATHNDDHEFIVDWAKQAAVTSWSGADNLAGVRQAMQEQCKITLPQPARAYRHMTQA
jgi:AAA domain (dynein-related subfamily)